ncbi:MAG: hypothetical protein SGPRY_009168, partial [Prymnesium sp.]
MSREAGLDVAQETPLPVAMDATNKIMGFAVVKDDEARISLPYQVQSLLDATCVPLIEQELLDSEEVVEVDEPRQGAQEADGGVLSTALNVFPRTTTMAPNPQTDEKCKQNQLVENDVAAEIYSAVEEGGEE